MNQRRRLIVRDSHKTTAGKVSVPVLPQFLLQILLKSTKDIYFQTEGSAPAPVSKFRDKSAMMVKPAKEYHCQDLNLGFSVPGLSVLTDSNLTNWLK